MYTMTPDHHFVIDQHPEHSNVLLAAGFSGHGFKFASVIGEVLCGMSTGTDAGRSASFLKLRGRF
jgi:N-methyl-L-tryptophan oxidase